MIALPWRNIAFSPYVPIFLFMVLFTFQLNFQVARQIVQFSHSTLCHMSGGFFSLQGATEELIHKIFGTFYTNDFSTSVVVGLNHKKSEAAANSQGTSKGILWTVGLPKYFLVKRLKLHRELWSQR